MPCKNSLCIIAKYVSIYYFLRAIAQQLQKHRFREVKKETREKIKQNEMIPV